MKVIGMKVLRRIRARLRQQIELPSRMDAIQEALGRIESAMNAARVAKDVRAHEFKVYSQWGEDGIIDFLASNVALRDKTFVEFGVEDYTEANTLFLLKHRGWRGLVIDGSSRNIGAIRGGRNLWRYDLYADCAFITRENINEVIERNGFSGDIGLLSIDIDGNDYWVWEAISCVLPRIVVVEYNSLFGADSRVTIPYDPTFERGKAHWSKMYYGASIGALVHLAETRGYTLVAGNSAGNNLFFVREDCRGNIPRIEARDAYVRAPFREARTKSGDVAMLKFAERQTAIRELMVVDVITGQRLPIRDVL